MQSRGTPCAILVLAVAALVAGCEPGAEPRGAAVSRDVEAPNAGPSDDAAGAPREPEETPVAATPRARQSLGLEALDVFGTRDVDAAAVGSPISARVLHRHGQPAAGVGITLHFLRADGSGVSQLLGRCGTTGADGVAAIARPGPFLASLAGHEDPGTFEIGVAIPGAEATRARIDFAAGEASGRGAAPIELTLPVLGRLDVMVTNADGTPAFGPLQVALARLEREDETGPVFEPCFGVPVFVEEGRVMFTALGLGREWRVTIRRPDDSVAPVVLTAAGPREEGEVVELAGRLGPLRPRLSGRVLGVDGQPLGGVEVDLFVGGAAAEPTYRRTTLSEEDGTFSIVFEDESAGEVVLALRAPDAAAHDEPLSTRRKASVDLRGLTPQDGVYAIGDLTPRGPDRG